MYSDADNRCDEVIRGIHIVPELGVAVMFEEHRESCLQTNSLTDRTGHLRDEEPNKTNKATLSSTLILTIHIITDKKIH